MRRIDLQLIIAKCNYVFDVCIFEILLCLKERIYFPLGVVFGQVLVSRSGWDDLYLLKNRHARGHELLCTELHPAFASVRYYVRLSVINTQLHHFLGCNLQDFQLLVDSTTYARVWVEHTGWINETGTKYCVIPVKYDDGLIHFWLLRGRQPDLVVGQPW